MAFTDESGESVWAIIIGVIVTILAGIDGGLSAVATNGDFWIGFGAGALGGALGYVATAFGHPFLGRAISSAVYDIANPIFQKGRLDQVDWLALMVDVPIDCIMSMFYYGYSAGPNDKLTSQILSAILIGSADGIIDVLQTPLYNQMGQLMNEKNVQTNKDAQRFYYMS